MAPTALLFVTETKDLVRRCKDMTRGVRRKEIAPNVSPRGLWLNEAAENLVIFLDGCAIRCVRWF